MARFYTDSHIAYVTSDLLSAAGHVVIRCQELGLQNAQDHEHLWTAASHQAILLTHDRGFGGWCAAWTYWTRQWNVSATHNGVLIVPLESLWAPARAADDVDRFVLTGVELENHCYRADVSGDWTRLA